MKTDELIRALAADDRKEASPARAVAMALPVALLAGILLFALTLRMRPDFAAAMLTPRLWVKFGFTISLALAAVGVVLAQMRPGAKSGPRAVALLLPLGILAIGLSAEIGVRPPDLWMSDMMGHYARFCVALVPLMAAPFLVALLMALRHGAPTRPALSGAIAGLAAGGFGATLYAFHCTDDSPLFVLVWYGIGVAIVTLAGALIGGRVLRW